MDATSNSTPILMFNIILLCVVNVVFTFVGIFLNSVVIISLLNSQLRRKICYVMILVLACFDLPIAAFFHPLITVKTLSSYNSTQFMMLDSTRYIKHLYVFSLTALLTMTVERYLALMYPFFHQKYMTKSRLIAVFLVCQLPFGTLYLLQLDIEKGIALTTVGVFVLVLCALNFKVFYLAKKLRRCAHITLGSLNGSEQRSFGRKNHKLTAAGLGKMSTCLIAALCLFICYCPVLLFVLTGNANRKDSVWRIINLWGATFVTLNSSLNCLIFFYRNSTLWSNGKRMLQKCVRLITRLHE